MKKLLIVTLILLLLGCRKEHRLPSSSNSTPENSLQTVPKCGNELDADFTAQMNAALRSYDEQEIVSRKRPKEFPHHDEEPTIIFLDTDGHTVKKTIWDWLGKFSFPAAGLSASQIGLILQSVSEDFSPFQIIVTADEKLYNKAKKGKRVRVIVTRHRAFEQIFPTGGGVAFIGSFWWGNDTPCFIFADLFGENAAHIAETVSHMVGHTFGLEHQAEYSFIPPRSLKTEFHNGFFSVPYNLFWKPIMGNPYNGDLSGWMVGRTVAGTFDLADTQDDMAILSALGVKPDALSTSLINSLSNQVSFHELINKPGDHDEYEVNSDEIKFSVQAGGNCDLRVEAFNSDRQLIAEYNDNNNLGISEKSIKTNGDKIYLVVGANGLVIGDLFSQPQMAGQYTLVVKK
jgi:hypothetical protein